MSEHDCSKCPYKRLCEEIEIEDLSCDDIKGYIEHQPTIEPKRGEWVKRTHDKLIAQVNFAYCSECGQPIMHEYTRPLWNFCPNCGAQMKGADDER